MKRRELITLLGGAAATWPLVARAQQPAIRWLASSTAGPVQRFAPEVDAFRQGLKETGYLEGQNVTIEYHWAEDQYDRLPSLAADLVQQKVTVIRRDQHTCGAGGQSGDLDGSDRIYGRLRPGRGWPGWQPQPAGR